MAKYYLVFLLGFLMRVTAQAQTYPHTIKASYGIASVQSEFHGVFKGFFSGVNWTRDTDRGFGPLVAQYHYAVTEKFEIGLAFSYTKSTLQGRYNEPDRPDPTAPPIDYGKVIGEEQSWFYAIMPSVQLNYLHTDKLKLYSGLFLGRRIRKTEGWQEDREPQNKTTNRSAFHLNVVGFQYGKRVAAFLEFGIGFHGVFNGGLAVKL